MPGKKVGQLRMVKCLVLEVEVKHHHQLENSNHLNGLIPWFFAVLATIHATFCLKSSEKKKNMYQKREASSNPTHLMGGSARPGTKSLGYGSESITQFISSISTRYMITGMFA